ncbi:MAG: DUF4175 family protein [Deltaproteobacteria bacterium]|nr:DUF4175 family protein [Deltaproteobacteria bacterium]
MGDFDSIRVFLAAVRRRLVWLEVAGSVGYLLAALGGAWLLLALVAAQAPSGLWPVAALVAALGALAAVVTLRVVPLARALGDERMAREVGAHAPAIHSDLLSAVQLARDLERGEARFSAALAHSLAHAVAADVGGLRPATIVTPRRLRVPGLLVLAVAAGYLLCLVGGPGMLRRGLVHLFVPPSPGGADAAEVPIIADLTVTYTYPAYMRRPPRTVTATSGDLLAPRGTTARLTARPIAEAERADLIVGESTRKVEIQGGLIVASLTVEQASSYRFQFKPKGRRSLREATAHRIDVEPDRPPRVEIYAPADDLEIAGQRKVEVGYQVDDDFGVEEVALLWRVGSGREVREVVRKVAPPQRNVTGRKEWDLASLGLKAGERVAYRFEARDNDNVAGPNFGSSRTLYLKIYSPREKHESLVKRQDEVFEGLLGVLADRLERPPQATDDAATAPALQAVGEIHRREEGFAQAAARLVPDLKADPLAPKDLVAALQGIGERLGALLQKEAEVLTDLGQRQRRGNLKAAALGRLRDENGRHVTELERDVILLDDLLGRQRLESLLQLADEMAHSRDRLRSLMEQYRRTRSEALRREIERALQQLEARVQELQAKMSELGRELPDEFLNREAVKDLNLGKSLAELRELLEKGDLAKAQAELDRLSRKLDDLTQALDGNLRSFRQERFAAAEKALGQMLDRVADLHAQEQEIARETERLVREVRQRSRDVTRDRIDGVARALVGRSDRLRQKLGEIRREALNPYHQEELDRTRARVEDLRKALDQGDLEEAQEMGRAGQNALRTLTEDLRDEVARAPWRKPKRAVEVRQGLDRAEEALPQLDEIVKELERALPRPEQLLDGEQRRRLAELAARQREVRRRTGKLAEEARGVREKGAAPSPAGPPLGLGEDAQKTLRAAGSAMRRAETRLRNNEPREAHGQCGEAVTELEKLRNDLKRARHPRFSNFAGQALDRSAVRIPGADEHRSPREFRQDLLDAMKAAPPAAYRDQVRRYYEELVR